MVPILQTFHPLHELTVKSSRKQICTLRMIQKCQTRNPSRFKSFFLSSILKITPLCFSCQLLDVSIMTNSSVDKKPDFSLLTSFCFIFLLDFASQSVRPADYFPTTCQICLQICFNHLSQAQRVDVKPTIPLHLVNNPKLKFEHLKWLNID